MLRSVICLHVITWGACVGQLGNTQTLQTTVYLSSSPKSRLEAVARHRGGRGILNNWWRIRVGESNSFGSAALDERSRPRSPLERCSPAVHSIRVPRPRNGRDAKNDEAKQEEEMPSSLDGRVGRSFADRAQLRSDSYNSLATRPFPIVNPNRGIIRRRRGHARRPRASSQKEAEEETRPRRLTPDARIGPRRTEIVSEARSILRTPRRRRRELAFPRQRRREILTLARSSQARRRCNGSLCRRPSRIPRFSATRRRQRSHMETIRSFPSGTIRPARSHASHASLD